MPTDLETCIALRRELGAMRHLEVAGARGEVLLVDALDSDRVVISRNGSVIGMFYVPQFPDVLYSAAGFADGERERLSEVVASAVRRRTELLEAFEKAFERLCVDTDPSPAARELIAAVQGERAAQARARRTAVVRYLDAREQRRSMRPYVVSVALIAGAVVALAVLSELGRHC